MSFDFGGSFDTGSIDSSPVDVPSDTNIDPQSSDYGSEQITSDQTTNPGDQVTNQSGNSDFVDKTNPGATDTGPAPTNSGATTQTFDDGSTLTTNPDGTVTATKAPSYTFEQLQAKAGNLIDQAQGAVQKQLAQISVSKIANSVITQAQNTAVNLAKQTANQALSTVVGPAAAASLTNSASRSIAGALAGNATPVNSSTNPQSPNFVGPPVPPASQVDQSAGNVGYTTGQDPENGTYYVKNEQTGAVVASGLTEQAATLRAQDQTFIDAGESQGTATGNSVAAGTAVNYTAPTAVNTTVNPQALVGPAASLANPGSIAAASIENLSSQLVSDAARAAALTAQAQLQQTVRQQRQNQAQAGDWRVRLRLAPGSNYLYNAADCGPVLWPLRNTDGVIFPYTPSIDTAYKANYSQYDLTHSNYRGYFYQNSYVDAINIKATFTAQDTVEANYLLAVIHFFRSVTKMFYGQDAERGSPPPLTYLSGLGDYQFNEHPCVVSQFNYNLPSDVNYIRAQSVLTNGTNLLNARQRQTVLGNPLSYAIQRLSTLGQGINPGALDNPVAPQGSLGATNPTYVPTKMDISLTLLPIQSRSQVSQLFSLKGFANGNLLRGGFW